MRSSLILFAALAVAGCADTATSPDVTGTAAATGGFTSVTASVPRETGPWLIVDESGATVWADETGGYFSVAYAITRDPTYFENCEVSGGTSLRTCAWLTAIPLFPPSGLPVDCPVMSLAIGNRPGTYTCVLTYYDRTVPEMRLRLTAAPTAPGGLTFRRWEITKQDGALVPCEESDGLACTFTDVATTDTWPLLKLIYGREAYPFGGFLSPVQAAPAENTAKAGRAVPIRFSLGGDLGLDILAAGSPSSVPATCDLAPAGDEPVATTSASTSGLSYDAETETYTYVWKTDKSWSGTCRTLRLTLSDDVTYEAEFRFTK